MSKILPDKELQDLDSLAHVTIGYLVLVSLVSFFAGAHMLPSLAGISVIGLSGSAIAALTSTLDRYAVGFERENGDRFPEGAKKGAGKFNRRFARWLFVRPLLGAVVAPVFVWGLSHFTDDPTSYLKGAEALGFSAFMGGLLAKSVLDLIKNLFKNVFRG